MRCAPNWRVCEARMAEPADGIGVVVVSHFSASTLAECLGRVLNADAVTDVVVVDNGSGDDTVAIARRIAEADPRLRIRLNPDNPGFAVACNQGAAALDTPWLAFVNPDLMVELDTLVRLREVARSQPRLGLVGADQVDAEGVADPAARRREPRLRTVLRGGGGRDSVAIAVDPMQSVQPVDAVSGALMLMPRELFGPLGGFDEGYRLHVEDVDLCRRVRDAGYGVVVANEVRVTHLRGVSSQRRALFVQWHKHRGMWRYFRKFEGVEAGLPARAFAFLAIWAHFILTAPRAWLRARHPGG